MGKHLDAKDWIGVLQYNEHAFEGHAYFQALQDQKLKVKETAKGTGPGIVYGRKAVEYMTLIQSFEKHLSPMIQGEYKARFKEFKEELATLEDENKKIYFEPVPAVNQVPPIDKQSSSNQLLLRRR